MSLFEKKNIFFFSLSLVASSPCCAYDSRLQVVGLTAPLCVGRTWLVFLRVSGLLTALTVSGSVVSLPVPAWHRSFFVFEKFLKIFFKVFFPDLRSDEITR